MMGIVIVAALLQAPAAPARESAAAAFRAGVSAQQAGELERAADAYRKAIELDPQLAGGTPTWVRSSRASAATRKRSSPTTARSRSIRALMPPA
jgi:predicted TPR repeat methyltransferase